MRHRLFAATSVLAIVAGSWSCGGGGSSSPTRPSATTGGPALITITANSGSRSFSPNPASVGGQMVAFRNADSAVHRVRLNDGSLDTGDIPPGATSQPLRMPSAGTNYHCALHTTMIGAVAPPSAPPPPCEGPYC